MNRLFDRVLDAVVPGVIAQAACKESVNVRCSLCVQTPFTPPQRFCQICELRFNCRTYCSYEFLRC
jgi:hypothetical protein